MLLSRFRPCLTVPLIAVLSCAFVFVSAQAELFVFRAMPARPEPTDWTGQFGASPQLHQALQLYETQPGMATALGVNNHFAELKANEVMRKKMMEADPVLFHTVDVAKYEVVMQVRVRVGAKKARRLGSTGRREYEIIEWARHVDSGGSMNPLRPLDPQKIHCSDDDNMFLVSTDEAYQNLTAHQRVNGRNAENAFAEVTREYMSRSPDPAVTGSVLLAETVETEFLSPTEAWDVIQAKGAEAAWPNYLFAWTAANPEKYNSAWGVEMLERWGWEKGVETQDVNRPVETTRLIRDLYPDMDPALNPKPPAEDPTVQDQNAKRVAHQFAYVANNYRQIYDVHRGHFLSQCKYLVRMIDSWEAIVGPEALPADYVEARRRAFAIYTSGAEGSLAESFKSEVGTVVDQVVEVSHQYHLERIGTSLIEALRTAGVSPNQTVSMDVLTRKNPQLLKDLNGLVVAYSNVPEALHQRLVNQFVGRIHAADGSEDSSLIYKSEVFRRILEIAQDEAGFTRGQIGSFRQIRADIELNLNEHLKGTDLDQFVEGVAKGEFSGEELRLVDDRIRRVRRQMAPEDIVRDLAYIHAVSDLFGWSSSEYSQRLKEYIAEGPSTALNMLRRIHDVFDSGRNRPVYVAYDDVDGNRIQQTIEPSGESLGIVCFKAALKGYDIWGKAQHGRTLYTNLYQIYGVGGKSDEEIGRLQAQAIASAADVYEFVRSDVMGEEFRLYGSGTMSEFLLGTPGAAAAGDPDAQKKLAGSAFKDLILAWQPQLAPAFVLFDISSWAYNEYNLRGSKAEVIDAMVENGQWGWLQFVRTPVPSKPGQFELKRQIKVLNEEELKKLNGSSAAKLGLAGIRQTKDGPVQSWRSISREGFKVTVAKTGQNVETRKSLVDVAYRGDYVDRSSMLKASEDSIRSLDQGSWAFGGILPQNSRNWSHKALSDKGMVMSVREDSVSTVPSAVATFDLDRLNPGFQTLYPFTQHLRVNQLRLLSYLVADFWKKRQELLEKHVFRDLEKEAARRLVDKIQDQNLQAGEVDLLADMAELDEAVKQIDKKLWPRVERSADPFPGSGYDSETDTPILEVFRRSTVVERKDLESYHEFLTDPSQTIFTEKRMAPGGALVPQEEEVLLDREAVKKKASALLRSMRDAYYEIDDGYNKVHALFEQGKKLAGEGPVVLEPFHLSLNPGDFSITAVIFNGLNPAAGDQMATEKWLAAYKSQRKRIANDVHERAKDHPTLFDFWDWADSFLKHADTGSEASPSHPLWPDLLRLRCQIQKLKFMQGYLADATPEELRRQLGRMTIKKDKPVVLPGDLAPGLDVFIRQLTEDMEEEYDRLLDNLTQLFEIVLTIDPDPKDRDPFIGQEVTVEASLKPDESGPPVALGPHGFPDYVNRFEWVLRDENHGKAGKSKITEKPTWRGYFPRTGLHLVEVRALDRGGNLLASQSLGANPQPITLVGNLEREEGDYQDDAISVLVADRKIGELQKLGKFEIQVTDFDLVDWSGEQPARAAVKVEGRSSSSNSSNIEVNPAAGMLAVLDDLMLKFPHSATIVTEVLDRAQLPMENVEVTVHVDGRPLPPGDSVEARLWRDQSISAQVRFEPLQLEQNTPALRFNPDEALEVRLEAELPMFDSEHLTVKGSLALGPVTSSLSSGTLKSNVRDQWRVVEPSFSFNNMDPIDLRAVSQVHLDALVTDSSDWLYQTRTRVVRSIGSGPTVDFGTIVLEPIETQLQFELTDWAESPLPVERTVLEVGGRPANRAGTRLLVNWPLSRQSQNVVVEAAYQMPEGLPVRASRTVAVPGWSPGSSLNDTTPMHLKLPVYLNLTVQVTSSIDVPPGRAQPGEIHLDQVRSTAGSLGLNSTLSAFGAASFGLPAPIRLRAPDGQVNTIIVEAAASADGMNYRGSGTGTVPLQPSACVVSVLLRPDQPVSVQVPDVTGMPVTQAMHLIGQANLKPQPVGGDPAPTVDQQYTVQSLKPSAHSSVLPATEVRVKVFGEFDIDFAVRNHDCSNWPGAVAGWDDTNKRPQCECRIPLQWNREGTACIDWRQAEKDNRCEQINEALRGASQAGDLNYFRQLLASAQDCDFFQRAYDWLQNTERCNQIDAALQSASRANDINQFRALVQQARDCGFYQKALGHLGNWERDLQRQQQQQEWNALIQTWADIIQGQGQTRSSGAASTSTPSPQSSGPEVSEAERKALEQQVLQAYRNPWHKSYCYCTVDEQKTDPTCLRRMPSGCILHARGIKDRFLAWAGRVRTYQELQKFQQVFRCADSCLSQGAKEKCANGCFDSQ